jgi:hypothetical protein
MYTCSVGTLPSDTITFGFYTVVMQLLLALLMHCCCGCLTLVCGLLVALPLLLQLLLLQLLAVSTSKARLRLPKAATFDDYLAAGEACDEPPFLLVCAYLGERNPTGWPHTNQLGESICAELPAGGFLTPLWVNLLHTR